MKDWLISDLNEPNTAHREASAARLSAARRLRLEITPTNLEDCCKTVEVDDLISQLTRGKHSIIHPVYKLQCTSVHSVPTQRRRSAQALLTLSSPLAQPAHLSCLSNLSSIYLTNKARCWLMARIILIY